MSIRPFRDIKRRKTKVINVGSVKIGGNGSATVTVNFDERNTDGATDTSIAISTITLMEVLA